MDGYVIRNGLAVFPTCTAVEYGKQVMLFSKTTEGEEALQPYFQHRTDHFFKNRESDVLKIYDIAPLDANLRSNLPTYGTVSPVLLKYGICTAQYNMVPTLMNYNHFINGMSDASLRTSEYNRQVVLSLVTKSDNTRHIPKANVIPFKRKERGINL